MVKRDWLKKLVFLMIAVALPFVVANEIVRWTWQKKFSLNKYFIRDWQLFYALRPNYQGRLRVGELNPIVWKDKPAFFKVSTNARGIRNPAPDRPDKPPRTYRILCLGDSITFGTDIDDEATYSYQLQALLNQYAGAGLRVEAINAGVPGYTSRQGLIYLQTRLLDYHPDLVILEFGPNDAQSVLSISLMPDKRVFPGDVENGFPKISHSPLTAASLLVVSQPLFGMARVWGMVIGMAMFKKSLQDGITAPTVSDKTSRFRHVRVPPEDYYENLRQFYWLSQRNRFRLMLYLPAGIAPAYHRLALAFAQDRQIPVMDFSKRLGSYRMEDLERNPVYLPLFQAYRDQLGRDFLVQNPELLLTSDGGHPNQVGNRIIAENLAGIILSHDFAVQAGSDGK